MRLFRLLRSVPITYRVPAIVALLMVVTSAVISERVLDRLSRTQEAFLDSLSETYLDGLEAAVLPAVLREDVWEIFDALERSLSSNSALAPIETVITGLDGRVLAASDPHTIATFSELPSQYLDRYGQGAVMINQTNRTGVAKRDLGYQGQHIGAIHATFDVSQLFAERQELLVALLVTNGVLALALSLGGFLLVQRMIAPMRVLENHMRAAAHGASEPIPPHDIPPGDGEVAGLFRGYNTLVHAERERYNLATRLADEEKMASLGRLASGMAHEINNPLGGLFNALDTLKKHGETPGVRDTSVSLIERGLAGIRDVVEAALATYRPERSRRPMTADDLDDVRLLMKPELRRRRQRLDWNVSCSPRELPVAGGPVRQAALNLLLNASAATPEGGTISLKAENSQALLTIEVGDEGSGIQPEIADILIGADPEPAVLAGRGLGLWMVRRLTDELGGTATIQAKPAGGTVVILALPLERSAQAHAA